MLGTRLFERARRLDKGVEQGTAGKLHSIHARLVVFRERLISEVKSLPDDQTQEIREIIEILK